MPAARSSRTTGPAVGGGGSGGTNVAGPIESSASELVDETAHPIDQVDLLETKVKALEAQGDWDTVVECRIKQKCLHQVLHYLHGFPLQPLVRAQAALAEAYASGGYFRQAHDHLSRAREVCSGGVYDDAQCQRLQVDLLVADGAVRLAQDQLEPADVALQQAARLVREVYGDMDIRAARIHTMLGQIAKQRGRHDEAIEHYAAAWEVREENDGSDAEETLRMRLRRAEVLHLQGRIEDAVEEQQQVVSRLVKLNQFPLMLVDSSLQLSRWLDVEKRDQEALEVLQSAERIVIENLGNEDAKAVEVKRDVALLHLKLGDHETALQCLNDVHYYERRLHGSTSTNVARTLKALGTVHMVRRNLDDAEQCLLQALRIFDAEHPAHVAIVRDIHAKLGSIGHMARGLSS